MWVWDEAPTNDPRQLLILLSLADVTDEHGRGAYPSKSRMARDSRSDERTVQRHLAKMVKAGILEVEAKATQHRPTTYTICMEEDSAEVPRGDSLSSLEDRPGETQGRQNGLSPSPIPLIGIGSNTPTVLDLEADFRSFYYDTYPLKVGPAKARRAFARAVKNGADPQDIIAGAKRYRDDPRRKKDFTAHPTSWLNAGRWEDQVEAGDRSHLSEHWQ